MDANTLLLPCSDGAVAGAVDFRGRPASRSGTGRWSAAMFVLGTAPPVLAVAGHARTH